MGLCGLCPHPHKKLFEKSFLWIFKSFKAIQPESFRQPFLKGCAVGKACGAPYDLVLSACFFLLKARHPRRVILEQASSSRFFASLKNDNEEDAPRRIYFCAYIAKRKSGKRLLLLHRRDPSLRSRMTRRCGRKLFASTSMMVVNTLSNRRKYVYTNIIKWKKYDALAGDG